jgi:uncharacterized protein GlcG (DUF336 family)
MTAPGQAPDAWKIGACCYGPGLNLELAKQMLEAGEKESVKQGVPMAMAISDSGGNLLAFHRMDNTMLVSTQIAMDKAFTSVFGKLPTGAFGGAYKGGELVPLFFHERWIIFNGGYPLIKDGVLMGGLGVSGGRIEDNFAARAIMKAGGFDYSDVDTLIKEYEGDLKKSKGKGQNSKMKVKN